METKRIDMLFNPDKTPIGWIELQDVMGNDLAIVNAARASYLGESKGEQKDRELLRYLMRNSHTTPFEMVEFKFRVCAPLIVTQQWMRHRTWSYNSLSARYTEAEEEQFYIPNIWRLQDTENKQASSGFATPEDNAFFTTALQHVSKSCHIYYQDALKAGIAREQARLFLPGFAFMYTFVAKVDAHNLMHFLKLRMSDHAQWEIRQYATAIYENFFKPTLPLTAEAFEEYRLNA